MHSHRGEFMTSHTLRYYFLWGHCSQSPAYLACDSSFNCHFLSATESCVSITSTHQHRNVTRGSYIIKNIFPLFPLNRLKSISLKYQCCFIVHVIMIFSFKDIVINYYLVPKKRIPISKESFHIFLSHIHIR